MFGTELRWILRADSLFVLSVAWALPSGADQDALEAGRRALEQCTAAAERQSSIEAATQAQVAEESFATLLDVDPANLEARLGIVRTLLQCRIEAAPMMEKMELLQRIESELSQVLAVAPDHWEAHFLYGTLLYNVPPFLGRTEDAIDHFEALIEMEDESRGPVAPEPYLFLGDLYRRQGSEKQAVEIWRRGRERFPREAGFDERLATPADSQATESSVSEHTAAPPPSRADAAKPPTDALRAALRGLIEREIARPEVPGLAVAVARHGEPLLREGGGMADVENEVLMTADSVVRIGSLTKQFTAVAVLRLAEQGTLAVDDPLARWLEARPSEAVEGVTLRHLLNHTSGLPQDPVEGGDWIADSLAAPRVGAPGERYAYSNLGYALLGRVLEAASGERFDRLLEDEVLSPAGLEATALCDERAIVPRRAQGYTWRGNRLLNDDPVRPSTALTYAGGLCSTVRDLLTWQLALHGGQVLSPAGYRTMLAVPTVADPAGTTYAAGLRIEAPREHQVIHHSGAISGFLSELAYYPQAELAIAVIANSEAADPRALGYEIAAMLSSSAP